MKLTKRTFAILASLAGVLLLAACSNQAAPAAPANQANSSMTATSSSAMSTTESSAASSSSQAAPQTTELGGTYKGMDEGDDITLVITGNTGTWTQVEPDGEQEIKQVSIDATNQRIVIGDDVERYLVNGNQLTIEDLDQDYERDTVVLTKQ
ncbi:SP_0198 family lipoprotein [Streptococcus himalayensis]|nr:SP_0198 family lipoprotein [Streptococcus himalayensis]